MVGGNDWLLLLVAASLRWQVVAKFRHHRRTISRYKGNHRYSDFGYDE